MLRASLVFRVRVLGLGFCVRVRVSVTGSVSYLNEDCSLHTLLLSAPAIHRQSSPAFRPDPGSLMLPNPYLKLNSNQTMRPVRTVRCFYGPG